MSGLLLLTVGRAGIAAAHHVERVALLEAAVGAEIDEHQLAGADQPLPALTLQANGGALPLRWLVNGLPIDSQPYRRQAQWNPDGRGQVRVTVIDRDGNSASSAVWIK